jgi:hypothetical protein
LKPFYLLHYRITQIRDALSSPSTEPAGFGTGPGLGISEGIAEERGGAITRESVEGEYPEVVVELSVSEEI